jgi:polysaccharide biosynthesis protein PslA
VRGFRRLCAVFWCSRRGDGLHRPRVGAYALDRFRVPRSQIWPILKAVVLAASALIACLFFVNAEAPQLRAFPFAFGASALLLLAGFRLGLRALIRRWTKAGRFRRRIAVVAVSDFSHEFIERLQAEPGAFDITGLYDDRLRFGRVFLGPCERPGSRFCRRTGAR